jgi:hypothetical protein
MPNQPVSHLAAALLVSEEVQGISFYFGHVHILPQDFRRVAGALRDGRIAVEIDPVRLDEVARETGEHVKGLYLPRGNTMVFRTNKILDSASGRGTVVHEASHAVADMRRKSTAIRSEEAAAFICEAWYLDSCGHGPELDDYRVSSVFFTIAQAMRERARAGVPVRATASEINDAREEIALVYRYESGFNRHDGV